MENIFELIEDSVEIVHESGKVGIVMKHGPIRVNVAFSPTQAEQVAAGLLVHARAARNQEPLPS